MLGARPRDVMFGWKGWRGGRDVCLSGCIVKYCYFGNTKGFMVLFEISAVGDGVESEDGGRWLRDRVPSFFRRLCVAC